MSTTEMIQKIYQELKARDIHPTGIFDKEGRFFLENSELISVRSPSRAWPYSEMAAGRTRKYVKKVQEKYSCKNIIELRAMV